DKRMGKVIKSIPKRDIEALQGYSWPGNIRELRNFVERSMILAKSSTLHFDFPQKANSLKSERRKLSEVEKDHIISVLKYSGWRIRGGNGAAAKLGLKPTTLEARIKKLGITRDPHSSRIS
ncbi:MAG: helix-turn-helix domain-containing protein, partial [Candidatus Binatia bacterium]